MLLASSEFGKLLGEALFVLLFVDQELVLGCRLLLRLSVGLLREFQVRFGLGVGGGAGAELVEAGGAGFWGVRGGLGEGADGCDVGVASPEYGEEFLELLKFLCCPVELLQFLLFLLQEGGC